MGRVQYSPQRLKRGAEMGRKIQGYEDWCPECGHLLSKKKWNCSFCGLSLNDLKINDFGIGSWDDYSDLNKKSNIDEDIDWLIDN